MTWDDDVRHLIENDMHPKYPFDAHNHKVIIYYEDLARVAGNPFIEGDFKIMGYLVIIYRYPQEFLWRRILG